MKVLMLSPMPPRIDGLADYAHGVRNAYERAGHVVVVVTDVESAGSRGAIGSLSLLPWRLVRTLIRVRAERPDVLHVQHTIATYGVRLLALWLVVLVGRGDSTFVVATHHEVGRDIGRLGWIGRAYYRLTAAWVDRLHVHTEQAVAVLTSSLRVSPSKVVLAPLAIFDLPSSSCAPVELRVRHALERHTVVLQFGFVQVEKGLLELVEALGVLIARRADLRDSVRLVVAGDVRKRAPGLSHFERVDREYLAAVRDAVTRHGLDEMVVFTGHVPADEVGAWFRTADW